MLVIRIISALVGIPIVLVAVFYGGPWYALFLLLAVNIGAYEYNNLLKKRNYNGAAAFTFIGVSLFTAGVYFEQFQLLYPLIMILFFMLFVNSLFSMDKLSLADSAFTLWGIIYLGGLAGFLLMLRALPDGALLTYIMLAGVWIHDTCAYFIGKKWGMRKFAPDISPNKSVEGSIAGITGTVAIFFSLAVLIPEYSPLNPAQAIVLALGIAVFSQLGDLLESVLKRQLGVKDSGVIIPGHGGILDRFDSILLTAPFTYAYFLLINLL